jgi:TolA-binding protein
MQIGIEEKDNIRRDEHASRFQPEIAIDLLVLLVLFLLLGRYFEPKYILSDTTTAGGDTASHYYTARYLKETLLPAGKIIGWTYANYAGFPLFQFYFPLPFLAMALFSLVVPLSVAFKLATVLGIFLLPLCTYVSLRWMSYRFPVPILGAVFTLPFLFMEANSMWGGNILSTLAGEFTYSLGFALYVLFVGSLYRGIVGQTHLLVNAVLVALIGMSHGYTLLFSGVVSLFFLIVPAHLFWERFKYLFKMHLWAILFMGLWLVPLLWHLPYTTRYNHIWEISGFSEVLPPILLPFVIVAIVGGVWGVGLACFRRWRATEVSPTREALWDPIDTRTLYLWFSIGVALFFYFLAYRIHVVDIRFLPFAQLGLMIIAAVEAQRLIRIVKVQGVIALLIVIGTLFWMDSHTKMVKGWIAWNYSGFEAKTPWPTFSSLNRDLAGTFQDPRVVYEHSSANESLGTIRAFESLPQFSGRATLEGLYMQSSITAPFVFYLQSELSAEASCPLSDYACSRLNLKNGIVHLKMFNVRDLIVRSDELKNQIRKYPEFVLEKSYGAYEWYRLATNENRYVTPLPYEPVFYPIKDGTDWKQVAYQWFKRGEQSDVHLAFTQALTADTKRFQNRIEGEMPVSLPKVSTGPPCQVQEELKTEEIRIQTNCLHRPLLIKISYHPNWRVEGANKVYLTSPSLMLIFPEQEQVRLTYVQAGAEHAGLLMTFIGLISTLFVLPSVKERRRQFFQKSPFPALARTGAIVFSRPKVAQALVGLLFILFVLFLIFTAEVPPAVLHQKAMAYLTEKEPVKAKALFETIIQNYPNTPAASDAGYFNAIFSFQAGDYPEAIKQFKRLIALHPESHWVPEAYYHIALLQGRTNRMDLAKETYQFVVDRYSDSRWAKEAKMRLEEMAEGDRIGPEPDYKQAMSLFDLGRYREAAVLFAKIQRVYPQTVLGQHAMYFHAICLFKQEQFGAAMDTFQNFVSQYPKSDYVAESLYHVGLSFSKVDQRKKAEAAFLKVMLEFPKSRWATFSKEELSRLTGRM